MIDLSKIKPGDEVMVRATVAPDQSHVRCVRVTVDGFSPSVGTRSCNLSIRDEDIVSHTPKALEVGDRVKAQFGFTWTIVAIHNGWAWLGDEDDSGVLRLLSELERVDA